MINFLNLEYLLVTAEELNFTGTTKKLFISRRSLSNHISNLEKELDVALLNRTPPFTLIYASQALEVRTRELPDLHGETYKEIPDIKDFLTGQLAISTSHTRRRIIFLEILPTYQAQFLSIELRLVEDNPSQPVPDLLHGSVDLVIDLLPFTVESTEIVPIYGEEILMVVPNELLKKVCPNRLEEVKQILPSTVDVTLLERCPFTLPKKGNWIHTISDEIFKDAQMSPRVVLETENIETVLALCAKGVGITFYPKTLMNPDQSSRSYRNAMLKNNHLNLYSLNYSRAHGVLGIGYHKGRYMSRATKEFIRIARERTPCPTDRPAE